MAPPVRRSLSAGLILVLAGCARTTHTPVDLQLDVAAALPDEAAHVRVCVEGGVARTWGAKDGMYALTGLVPDAWPVVTVQALDGDLAVLGQAGPVDMDEDYVLTGYAPGSGDVCIGGGGAAPEGDDTWVLGVRFWEAS